MIREWVVWKGSHACASGHWAERKAPEPQQRPYLAQAGRRCFLWQLMWVLTCGTNSWCTHERKRRGGGVNALALSLSLVHLSNSRPSLEERKDECSDNCSLYGWYAAAGTPAGSRTGNVLHSLTHAAKHAAGTRKTRRSGCRCSPGEHLIRWLPFAILLQDLLRWPVPSGKDLGEPARRACVVGGHRCLRPRFHVPAAPVVQLLTAAARVRGYQVSSLRAPAPLRAAGDAANSNSRLQGARTLRLPQVGLGLLV